MTLLYNIKKNKKRERETVHSRDWCGFIRHVIHSKRVTQGHGPIQICSLNDLVKNSDSVHGSKRCWLIHRCFNWKGTKASVSLKQCSAVWNNVKVISLTVSVGCRRVLTWPPGILWAVPPDPHDSALRNAVPVLATSLPEHGNTPTLYPPTTHTLATTTWTRGGVSDRGKPKEREELVWLVLKEKSKAVKKKKQKTFLQEEDTRRGYLLKQSPPTFQEEKRKIFSD